MSWTQFWDMHSGGSQKESAAKIYIEAPEAEARSVFYSRFGHNPDRVSCTCCGPDYSIDEYDTLEHATAFHRGCDYEQNVGYVERPSRDSWRPYVTLDEYLKNGAREREGVPIVIRAADINDWERTVDVPRQGYIWQD